MHFYCVTFYRLKMHMINHYRADVRQKFVEPKQQQQDSGRGTNASCREFGCPIDECHYKVKNSNMDHMVTHLR